MTLLPLSVSAIAGIVGPDFSKAFQPDTIGVDSVSTLVFTIDNSETPTPATDLAFTDNLPMGLTIADPAIVTSTCGGTVTAPFGGDAITLVDGAVGGFSTCTVSVDVTSDTADVYMNTSGNLTSSAGTGGTASATLTVDANRLSFTKVFSPSTVAAGGRSTLTFTISNNTGSFFTSIDFQDVLPIGVIVADPPNVSNSCAGTIAATSGGGTVGFEPGAAGFILGMSTCTISVDVVGAAAGLKINSAGPLTYSQGITPRQGGKANAALDVVGGDITFVKEFLADPVAPGGSITLRFTLTNTNRDFDATDIAFMDDLDATLTGLAATGLPTMDVCGAGSQISGTSILSLTGGMLAADGGTCSFDVTVQVPAMAAPGSYPNFTTPIEYDFGGGLQEGNSANDSLTVSIAPILTKQFLPATVGAGQSVSLEFTLTNNSDFAATGMTFVDNLIFIVPEDGVLPGTGYCGAGSGAGFDPDSGDLTFVNASVPAHDSCTFTFTFTVPAGTAPGAYLNTTSNLEAAVDGMTQFSPPAMATLNVVGAPSLSKEFTDDPVLPGQNVTLQFTISHDASAPADATGISFTDDLTTALSGLAATGLPMMNVCGSGSSISGTTVLSFSGGTLAPGASCTFSVTLSVPGNAPPGGFLNQTSDVSAMVSGIAVQGAFSSDTLLVGGLKLIKEFTDDPVLPGGTAMLEFTLDNTDSAFDATNISFEDDLNATLSGLTTTGALPMAPCGMGSSLTGPTDLIFAGGTVLAGQICTFSVTVDVPGAAAEGDYPNLTTPLTATIDGNPVTLDPAADALSVVTTVLTASKSFTDDPVQPGGQVTLEFTITNTFNDQVDDITLFDSLDTVFSGLAPAMGELPAMDVCGTGSSLTLLPTATLMLDGGTLAPTGMAGDSCTFSVLLDVPVGIPLGSQLINTTSEAAGLIAVAPVTGNPASDPLQVDSVSLTKAFDGPTTAGGTPTLTFTVTNLGALDVTGVAFLDDLNAVLPGLVATNLPLSNVCGAGSSVTGSSVIQLSNGSLDAAGGANDSCIIVVNLQVPSNASAGTFMNTTGSLFVTGVEAGAPAMDAVSVEPPPTFSKAFLPDTIPFGETTTLVFTIDNTASALAASSMSFTDNLPAGLLVAAVPNVINGCGGMVTENAGTGVISLNNGLISAATSCTVSVDVTATTPGTFINMTGELTTSSGSGGMAGASLTANPPPAFAKVFAPDAIAAGGISTLTFTIDNSGSTVAATGLAFTDNLPGGVIIASPANASNGCTGGTLTATAATTTISLSGASVASGISCVISVDVTSGSSGSSVNTTGDLTSSLGNSGTAGDTLNVNPPPAFTKEFSPDPVALNGIATLTFTIDNTASTLNATGLDFTDNMPSEIVIATPSNASTTCTGGTLTAVEGTSTISYSGGSVDAGMTCTVQVDVTSNVLGTHVNTSGLLTSTGTPAAGKLLAGTSPNQSGPAVDSLTVVEFVAEGDIQAIPTLTQWGLLLLAGLMAGFGVRRLIGR